MVGHMEVQVGLIFEIVKEESFGDSGPGGNVVGAGALVLLSGKDLCGGIQNLALLFLREIRKRLSHGCPSLY